MMRGHCLNPLITTLQSIAPSMIKQKAVTSTEGHQTALLSQTKTQMVTTLSTTTTTTTIKTDADTDLRVKTSFAIHYTHLTRTDFQLREPSTPQPPYPHEDGGESALTLEPNMEITHIFHYAELTTGIYFTSSTHLGYSNCKQDQGDSSILTI